jgi:glyoxylase-like metal-dependent hydrolase (beta-lactamase superfamily II)
MRVYAMHGGGEKADMACFDPFHPEVGTTIDIPYFFYLVEHDEGKVLFDTGGHPQLIDEPERRLGAAADVFELTMKPGDDVVSRLGQIGVAPADVTHVALSHLHYDHAGGVEFFPESEHLAHELELEFAYDPPIYQKDIYLRQDFDCGVSWTAVGDELDVFGDGRVVLFATPGHTKGHQSMLVKLDDRALILAADAAYLPHNLEERALPAIVWSPDAMVASWERIEALQREHDAELIFTHDLAWREKTRVAPDAYYE